MAMDTPARIAVLGAGPIGLEAALYARFLGYEVEIYERGAVGENLRQWRHVRLFSPFGMNASPLALAALAAQDGSFRPPHAEALLTGQEFLENFLLPLAETDLLAGGLKTHTEVLAISRGELLKGDRVGCEDREIPDFRLLVREASGRESNATADVVIDATGTYGNHNWAGIGGIPALGERGLASSIEYGLPDVLGRHRETYTGRHTLVIGNGYSAATTIVALAELARHDGQTRATWITRGAGSGNGPIAEIAADRLPERHEIARRANELAAGASTNIVHRPRMMLEEIARQEASDRVCVTLVRLPGELDEPPGDELPGASDPLFLSRSERTTLVVDRVVANVGYRPDSRLWSELQVHECYASGGPMKLAAALLGENSRDCLDQGVRGPQTLIHPEPDFYVLGAKSYGRNSQFLMSAGLLQIRDLFTILADRAELDLYAHMAKLPE